MELPEGASVKLLREEVVKCPVCGKESMKVSIYSYDMPMIGPVIMVVGKCSECGYKFVDIRTWESKGDQKIEFKVEDEKDLNTLVLRSSTASLEIPELQAELTPGPASQGFLTTVEGVLQRFKDIIEYLCKDAHDEKEKAECEKRLEVLKEMLEGKRKFTIIIRDPEGHSKIASEKAKEEVKRSEEGMKK
ncbi:ZPR1-related zinc finger protein [Ignicoccus hospitalis KIN4/I]|uniref:ZPR1-related zinc finger protein n=1 Tax=Ignicoccus hospitalis (strain KIN4/I / DSM 18386 / JCM 14125) TaxID=453591 RepID=A8ABI0_IGNH4|nr:ZPR1-related zinc finger protein [Ignicoccus hospitalis KIN4/I]